ncbi:MAG: DUF4388 domain-containing protein [Acidobacteriota bacterium]
MAFQGSLAELPLPDIIQLVSVSGKTGRFTLTRDDRAGQIYLRSGQIVHASSIRRPEVSEDGEGDQELRGSELTGEEAIYELATWNDGDFVFTPGEESADETIDKPNTNLLMEAARRMDEWQVLRKKIESTALVPRFAHQTSSAGVSFTAREWAIAQQINGRHSIDDIALALGESAFSTSKDLYGLLTSGQVALSTPPSAEERRSLRSLSAGGAAALGEALERAVLDLTNLETATPTLRRSAKLAQAQIRAGKHVDALIDLLHAHENVIRESAGEAFVQQYRDRFSSLLDID